MIVSAADPVQAFWVVQIGANKPLTEERKETPHLLVDVADTSKTTMLPNGNAIHSFPSRTYFERIHSHHCIKKKKLLPI
jgi:hypothetical protein